jgi:ABC-2 type transport system permease protein
MWADTLMLMRHYWKLDQREYSRVRGWKLIGYIAAVIAFLFIGVFSAAIGYGASFLLRPEMPVRVGPGVFPGLLLTFVLLGVLITGLNQAVRALFLSGDLERLVVAPVRTRSVMIAKLLSRLPGNVSILLVVAVPAFVAYGIGVGAGVIYYLLGLLLLLLAPLFGLGVGALLAMVLVRLMPPNRLNEMLAASYALFGIMFALIAQLPRLFFTNEETSLQTLETAGEMVGRIEGLPVPTLMAGRGLMALDAGQLDGGGLLGILFYLLITAGLFLGVVMFGERFYLSGWLKAQSAGGKRRALDADGGAFSGRSLAVSLGLKDWLLRLRDPRQLVSLLGGGLIAIVVSALAIFNDNGGQGSLLDATNSGAFQAPGNWAALTAAFSPGVIMSAWAIFAAYVILSTPAMSALALEGRSFTLLKAAPLRPRQVWWAKMWSTLIPGTIVFAVFLLLTRLVFSFSIAWMPYALAAGLLMNAGLTMINVSAGFRFANLDWVDPRRMTTSGGGWVSFIFTLIYGLPSVVITLAPFAAAQMWPQWSLALMLAGLLLLGGITWVLMVFMARWAEKAWELLPA